MLKKYAIRSRAERNSTNALVWYIHALIDSGEVGKAARYARQVLTWSINSGARSVVLIELARVKVASGDGDGALVFINRSLATRTSDGAEVFRALVLVWLGRFKEAAATLRDVRSSELPPELQSTPGLISSLASAAPQREAFSRQIQRFPTEQSGYLLKAAMNRNKGELTKACGALEAGKRRAISTTLLAPSWRNDVCEANKTSIDGVKGCAVKQ